MLKPFFFKIRYDFFYLFLERHGRMYENKKINLFLFIYYYYYYYFTKTKYLIPNLYLYSIKIQTNIDQKAVKYLQKMTDFFKRILFEEIFLFSGWAQPGPCGWAGPSHPCMVTGQASDPNKTCTRKILRMHGTVQR